MSLELEQMLSFPFPCQLVTATTDLKSQSSLLKLLFEYSPSYPLHLRIIVIGFTR